MEQPLFAFVDESQSDRVVDPGTYILAAAVCDEETSEEVQRVMRGLLLRGQRKLHWRDESEQRRHVVMRSCAKLAARHVIVVRSGHGDERSEWQRRKCLESLLVELDQIGVRRVVFESRGRRDDQRDRDMLTFLRSQRRVSADVRVDHEVGRRQPMLWLPDTVCGAVVAQRVGQPVFLAQLRQGASVTMIELDG
ncbi:MAG: hypothetical protein QM621_13350 [Aeromicrobium sp.]|uniref:hypothetical protein n=1 Tax=Aeromicrobium sp. TaxID=1871063 RepID=UPI0039E69396